MNTTIKKENGLRVTKNPGEVTLLSIRTEDIEAAVKKALKTALPWGANVQEYFIYGGQMTTEMWSAANEAVRKLIRSKVQSNARDWAQRIMRELKAHAKRKDGALIANEDVKELATMVVDDMRDAAQPEPVKSGKQMVEWAPGGGDQAAASA